MGLAILAGSLSFVGAANATELAVDGSYESALDPHTGTGGNDFAGFDGGWTHFTTYNYSLGYTGTAPGGSGSMFLRPYDSGGGSSMVTQTNTLTRAPELAITTANIDARKGQYTFSAWFSTYNGDNDYSDLTLQFLDATTNSVGSPVGIGGAAFVKALPGGTGPRAWGQDSKTGLIPPGARFASITSVATALQGNPDGYVDLVSLDVISNTLPISVASATPIDSAVNVGPGAIVSVVLRDGTLALNNSSIQLSFDGSAVLPSILPKSGDDTTIQYDPPGLLLPLSPHTYKIAYNKDGGATPNTTNQYSFTVGSYVDIILPSPIPGTFENFNSTAPGGLPAGWTATNLNTLRDSTSEPGIVFTNLDSDAYTNWTVVEASLFTGTFDTYSHLYNSLPQAAGEATDYHSVLSFNPFNVVNGAVVSNLANGRFAFGNSGYRLDALGQVLYMFTKDFNVTGYTNVYLSYHSLWEQNQDSIGSVEYSIDQGTNWLPVVYMLDGPDVLTNLDGSINPVATFTNVYPPGFEGVATYINPDTLETNGGFYGAFIGVASNQWSTLAPYISRRVNDDPVESKRVEIFRLTQADNKPNVRFRFAHAGTDSWYFGIDDFGLYSLPPLKITSIVPSGANVLISWPGAAGTKLQKTTSLASPNWQDVSGSNGASSALDAVAGTAFYRITRPY